MVKDYGDKKRDLPFVILSPLSAHSELVEEFPLRINSEKNQYEPREESPVGTDLQVCPLRMGLKTRPHISFSVSASNQTVIASEAKQSQSTFHPAEIATSPFRGRTPRNDDTHQRRRP
jgi:hypothetical protein